MIIYDVSRHETLKIELGRQYYQQVVHQPGCLNKDINKLFYVLGNKYQSVFVWDKRCKPKFFCAKL